METVSNIICQEISKIFESYSRDNITITTLRTKLNDQQSTKYTKKQILEAIKGDNTLSALLDGDERMNNPIVKDKKQ